MNGENSVVTYYKKDNYILFDYFIYNDTSKCSSSQKMFFQNMKDICKSKHI